MVNIPPILSWVLTPSYQITDFNVTYRIRISGMDNPDSDDFIGGYNFSFSLIANAGYPTTYVLQLSGDPLKIELGLQ